MCKVEWCNNKPNISGKGYCRMHYDQIRKYGHITTYRPAGHRNNYVKKDNYTELQILNNDESIKVVIKVDTEDVEKLKKYSFRYEDGKYAKTVVKNKTIYLHQLLLGKNNNLEIDHINRDKLDNRKSNLRSVTPVVNANNKDRSATSNILKTNRNLTKPYYVSYTYNKKKYYLGYFLTLEEAKEKLDKHRRQIILP